MSTRIYNRHTKASWIKRHVLVTFVLYPDCFILFYALFVFIVKYIHRILKRFLEPRFTYPNRFMDRIVYISLFRLSKVLQHIIDNWCSVFWSTNSYTNAFKLIRS